MMDADNYAKALKKAGDKTVVETQLTTEGIERFGYARRILPEQQDELKKEDKGDTNQAGIRAPAIAIHWSKDSKKFAVVRDDFRKVPDYWVIHSLANPRPILESYPYPLPGEDAMPISQLDILDVATKQLVVVQAKNFPEQQLRIADAPQLERDREELRQEQDGIQEGGQMPLTRVSPRWISDTSDKLYFTSINRDFRKIDVCAADTSTGASKTLIEERSNVWLSVKPLRLTGNGQELIWWSERDGWAHYYLFDAAGKLKNQITSGEYVTDQILDLDEKSRTLYFTANGRERNEDPYYTHLYRINLDGSGLQLLSPGNFLAHVRARPIPANSSLTPIPALTPLPNPSSSTPKARNFSTSRPPTSRNSLTLASNFPKSSKSKPKTASPISMASCTSPSTSIPPANIRSSSWILSRPANRKREQNLLAQKSQRPFVPAGFHRHRSRRARRQPPTRQMV